MDEETKNTGRYLEQFQDKTAIIFDDDQFMLYVDIAHNYPHTKYLHTNETHAKDFLNENLWENNYILYLNKRSDEEIIKNILDNHHYIYQPLDRTTDFYDVYKVSKGL